MKHFLELADWSSRDLHQLLAVAQHLKMEWQSGGNRPILKNKILGMVFQKPSLRTRVSFEVAMKHLGGDAIMLGTQEIGLGKRESVADVSRVLSSYVSGIMARVFEHEHVTELAKYSRVPVINGLSDDFHPCQAMADLLTIHEHYGKLTGLRIAYVGDGNNVAASLAIAAAHFGMDFSIATPEGYALPPSITQKIRQLAHKNGTDLEITTHVDQAIDDADVLYTDTWVSMGQEGEGSLRREIFRPYQINDDVIAQTNREPIVLHCLPAHRGDEITDAVMDGEHSKVFEQAENRLHAQKAILVNLLA